MRTIPKLPYPQMHKLMRVVAPAICLLLLILHAFESVLPLTIDEISLWLLALAFAPFVLDFVEEINISSIAARFRRMDLNQQLEFFVSNFGHGILWTFYEPREKVELNLGKVLKPIVDQLRERERPHFYRKLRDWLKSDDEHRRWMAAEIVGYYRIDSLRHNLPVKSHDAENPQMEWRRWQLNSLWAYSRFESYKSLADLLIETTNPANQLWILHAYRQMPREHGRTNEPIVTMADQIDAFLKRDDIIPSVRVDALDILSELKNPMSPSSRESKVATPITTATPPA